MEVVQVSGEVEMVMVEFSFVNVVVGLVYFYDFVLQVVVEVLVFVSQYQIGVIQEVMEEDFFLGKEIFEGVMFQDVEGVVVFMVVYVLEVK